MQVGSTSIENSRSKLTEMVNMLTVSTLSCASTTPSQGGLRPPPPRHAPPPGSVHRRRPHDEEDSPPYERRGRKTDADKWPSESSGIYTGSIQSREESAAELDPKRDNNRRNLQSSRCYDTFFLIKRLANLIITDNFNRSFLRFTRAGVEPEWLGWNSSFKPLGHPDSAF